jgi:hypothetical protein
MNIVAISLRADTDAVVATTHPYPLGRGGKP